uniref:DHC_N2 domain-containing protein n=1 Tax=Gongylonema pulchrum TaxID=637853 RepID=A0A183DHW2_9BILA
LEQMDESAQLRKELDDKESFMKDIRKAGEDIQSKCHSLAEHPMKYWLEVVQTRWDEVSNAVDGKRWGRLEFCSAVGNPIISQRGKRPYAIFISLKASLKVKVVKRLC